MGLGSVHRLCVVGSLGERRLRSHGLSGGSGGGACSSQALREGVREALAQAHKAWAQQGLCCCLTM